MDKKVFIWLLIIILISGGIYSKIKEPKVKIDKNKSMQFIYIYEIEKNKMGMFDITNSVNREDIDSIVNSLNKGVLIPDEKELGTYTLEHIEIFVLGDRDFSIYKQKDGSFTVMYSINPDSNVNNEYKQTTINSEVLQNYFAKFKQISKNFPPSITWDLNKN